MRYSLPAITGARGAGLGNEVIPWGKAFLAAQALGLRLVDPPWWLNKRPYGRDLQASVLGTAGYLALRALPSISIDSAIIGSLRSWDYFDAMAELKTEHLSDLRSRPVLMHSSGMAGGYLAIRRARRFLAGRLLYSAHSEAALTKFGPEAAVRIGVHVRAGDFSSDGVEPGVFNVQSPAEWYIETITSLLGRLGVPAQILVASQGAELTAELARDNPGGLSEVRQLKGSSVDDLAVLASCDVIVPSISSFSLLAIFLSEALYVWPAQHLNDVNGWRDIWGHEPRHVSGPTARARDVAQSEDLEVFRGIPRSGSEPWPDWFVEQIRLRAYLRRQEQDLTLLGVTRQTQPRSVIKSRQ